MSGLDAIIDKINEDAKLSCEARIENAAREAEKTKASKAEAARLERERLLGEAKDAIGKRESKAKAAALSAAKRRVLEEKVAVIDEVLAETKERFIAMPADETFTMIRSFVEKSSEGEDGRLILAKKDLPNVPNGFAEAISKQIGATVEISEEAGDFAAGCILICGDIEYNGTVDALFENQKEQMRDVVNQILFGM